MHTLQQNDKFSDLKKQYLCVDLWENLQEIFLQFPHGERVLHIPHRCQVNPLLPIMNTIWNFIQRSWQFVQRIKWAKTQHKPDRPLWQVSKHGWQQWHQDRNSGQQDGAHVQVKMVTVITKSKYWQNKITKKYFSDMEHNNKPTTPNSNYTLEPITHQYDINRWDKWSITKVLK